jgi:glycine/D-amino acid oxidase-like deaminating enzyme
MSGRDKHRTASHCSVLVCDFLAHLPSNEFWAISKKRGSLAKTCNTYANAGGHDTSFWAQAAHADINHAAMHWHMQVMVDELAPGLLFTSSGQKEHFGTQAVLFETTEFRDCPPDGAAGTIVPRVSFCLLDGHFCCLRRHRDVDHDTVCRQAPLE